MPFCPVAPLNAGDRLTIVAPAGPFERAVFEQGLTQLPPGARFWGWKRK